MDIGSICQDAESRFPDGGVDILPPPPREGGYDLIALLVRIRLSGQYLVVVPDVDAVSPVILAEEGRLPIHDNPRRYLAASVCNHGSIIRSGSIVLHPEALGLGVKPRGKQGPQLFLLVHNVLPLLRMEGSLGSDL